MSSRVLTAAPVAAAPRQLAPPDPARDPFIERLVASAASDAYQRGVADGRLDAAAEAAASAARAADAVRAALADAAAARRVVYAEDAAAAAELAYAIAELVVAKTPADDPAALVTRLEEALASLDDDELVISVAPADADIVAAGLTGAGVVVRADTSLAPGDARISGTWARADLTRAGALHAVRAHLGVDVE